MMRLIPLSLALSLIASASPAAQYSYPVNVPQPSGGNIQPYTFWSSAYGSAVHGDVVTIPSATTVYLDQDTPILGGLIIRGKLIFHGNVSDLILSANWIYVEGPGGILQAGSAPDPRLTPGTIHLIKDANTFADPTGLIGDSDAESALNQHGLVVANGGKLHLFGEPRTHSWMELQNTATKGSSTCGVASGGAHDWTSGDMVFLASTDFDWTQAEQFTITAVNGDVLTLSGNLQNEHYGSVESATGQSGSAWEIRQFGEVGLLNRNVVVSTRLKSGSNWLDGDGSFGHVMFMQHSSSSAVPIGQFSWTELHHLGLSNTPGRYPIHYHHMDPQNPLDNPNSFVEY